MIIHIRKGCLTDNSKTASFLLVFWNFSELLIQAHRLEIQWEVLRCASELLLHP